jgi:hypothetical protein
MDKQHVLAAWIAGGVVWLGAVGGMAMLDDGVPGHPAEQLVEHAAPEDGDTAERDRTAG